MSSDGAGYNTDGATGSLAEVWNAARDLIEHEHTDGSKALDARRRLRAVFAGRAVVHQEPTYSCDIIDRLVARHPESSAELQTLRERLKSLRKWGWQRRM